MNQANAIKYLRGAIDEMTLNEFQKRPIAERIQFAKAALKATETISVEPKELPVLLKKQIGIGDAPHC